MDASQGDHEVPSAAAGDSADVQRFNFTNINGVDIELQVINHQPSLCQEFVVKSPRFNFRQWLSYTVILYAAAYFFQLHIQDIRYLIMALVVISVAVILKVNFKVSKESLLVISTVGIQLTTTYASGRQITKFYDMCDVDAVIINEGITMHRVIFYLAILVGRHKSKLDQRLVPLFTNSWPRIACLTRIYQEVSQLLPGEVDSADN